MKIKEIIFTTFFLLNVMPAKADRPNINSSDYSVDAVKIDSQGFVYKNGVKIFPMGVYITTVGPDDLARIKAAGFNTILSYTLRDLDSANDFLDLADRYGLNVVYSLKDYYRGLKWAPKDLQSIDYVDGYIKSLKSHKSLLAWYINDELPLTKLPVIKKMAEKINLLDGNHPVLQVLYDIKTVGMYVNTSDIIALHAYPVGVKDNLLLSSSAAEKTVSIASKQKSPWFVPQIMDLGNYKKDMPHHPPSMLEMKNQAYQAIIAGTKGIIFYSYYDLFYSSYPRSKKDLHSFNSQWQEVVAMMRFVKPIIPVILHGNVIYENKFDVMSDAKYKFYKYGQHKYLLLANPYYKEVTIRFKNLDGEFSISNIDRDIKIVRNVDFLSLTLPPLYSGFIVN